YGFHLGDHAISLFAALMRLYFFAERHFLGHVGGDDFFIGIVERLEIVEVAIAEVAELIAVTAGLTHEIADGAIARQAG
ncbi:hypothetical protein ACC733_38625, partial [Rhizobium johnstonii]|uniref:hypothetical protein n=1 Tax=Rhizobium johnstonii TaxID=3019933 RepID=UPI003F9BFF29